MIPLAQPGPMTEDERFMFECYGYLIIEDVMTPDEIDEALAASKRIHTDTTEVFSPLGNSYEREPALARLIEHPAVIPKVRGLYGDKFVMQSGWCARLVANGSIVGWHQDGSGSYGFEKVAYPLPLLQLRASFSLTDQSHEFMGNMMMIPGSHRSPLPMPRDKRKEVKVTPIQHNILCKAGTMLLFHNGVWHSPMPNNEDYDRYNMHYIYSPPWMRRADRFASDAEFMAEAPPLRRALMGDYERPTRPSPAASRRCPSRIESCRSTS